MLHSDIADHIPEYVGTVRVVHAGNCYDESLSKSRSLKIERKSDGTIAAWCFRCGARYFGRDRSYVPTKGAHRAVEAPRAAPSVAIYSDAPRRCVYDLGEWPSVARTWLRRARLTQNHCDRYKIGYVPGVGVILVDPSCETRYLVRPFKNGASKYIVRGGMSEFIVPPATAVAPPGATTAVLVEDCLSAIRVADCGATGVALLGTNLKDETKEKLLSYQRLVLWLDDDSPTVRVIQARLGAVLRQFAPTHVVRGQREPKNLPDREILTILSNFATMQS